MNENKFYRSNLHGRWRMIPLVILILLAFFIMRNYYDPIDNFYFLMIALICSPLVILFMVYFVSWLVSVKNAKISYIELSENFISINNINWFLKKKQEYIEIVYNDIETIKIFFDYPFRCYNINIYKKWCKQGKDVVTFELKIRDYSTFMEVLTIHGVTVSRCSHF